MTGTWQTGSERPTDDPFLRAIRGRMEPLRAPEGLRARIGAMLAVERGLPPVGEPENG